MIAVLTFRRNDDLRRALPPMLREAESVPGAGVLVVDNDPAAGARDVVEFEFANRVRYIHEPAPGIAAARNRAMAEAGTRFIAFIDDDMHPEPGWLAHLLETQLRYDAVGVAGPVLEEYEKEPEAFVRAGRFFVRRRLPTGTKLTIAASGNLLLDLHALSEYGLSFNRRFGLLGGSDSLLTRDLARRGGLMVWCDEAITYDRIPADRATREWVLRRAFRVGNTTVLASLALARGPWERVQVRLAATFGGLARIIVGRVRTLVGMMRGSMVHRARGLRTARRGAGMLVGAWGGEYAEYARPESSSQASVA